MKNGRIGGLKIKGVMGTMLRDGSSTSCSGNGLCANLFSDCFHRSTLLRVSLTISTIQPSLLTMNVNSVLSMMSILQLVLVELSVSVHDLRSRLLGLIPF